MACSASTCQSNCFRSEQDDSEEQPQHTKASTSIEGLNSTSNGIDTHSLCFKCKANRPISAGGDGDAGRFCGECFRNNMFGKFRLAVTSNAMITPTDNVLVAFSGGASSRVALQFVHEMQQRAQKNFDASRDRSLPVFGVGVALIDESAIFPIHSCETIAKEIEGIRHVVSGLDPPTKELHVSPIESAFSSESSYGRDQLEKLLDGVTDATGKEDLLVHLRMLALQKIASENGYNRLVLGSCASRIACHVLSATVKGKGYSLSADIQYVDARWEVPVVLPLRDCLTSELNLLCRLDGLQTTEMIKTPSTGINGLISSFVKLLQEENPSRESTIMRTAGKLTPFHFNRIPEINDCNVPLAMRRRQKRNTINPSESISSELFCAICNSPLSRSEMLSSDGNSNRTDSALFVTSCCMSCRFQILPKDPELAENFCSLLPKPFVSRTKPSKSDNLDLLRERIQDCLISDNEDET